MVFACVVWMFYFQSSSCSDDCAYNVVLFHSIYSICLHRCVAYLLVLLCIYIMMFSTLLYSCETYAWERHTARAILLWIAFSRLPCVICEFFCAFASISLFGPCICLYYVDSALLACHSYSYSYSMFCMQQWQQQQQQLS